MNEPKTSAGSFQVGAPRFGCTSEEPEALHPSMQSYSKSAYFPIKITPEQSS